jgi:hypothetical protein
MNDAPLSAAVTAHVVSATLLKTKDSLSSRDVGPGNAE